MTRTPDWTYVKLKRAASMLEAGFSPVQISSRLCLSPDRLQELAAQIEPTGEMPGVESRADWRRRKREKTERIIIGIVEKYLSAVTESSFPLDRATMRTFRAASDIAYKWLRGDPLPL
jgi:hypothetical protein